MAPAFVRLVLLSLVLTLGCASGADPAAVRTELMDADRAFAAATAERGVDGWTEWFAEDGAMYLPAAVVRGQSDIRETMQPVFADSTRRLTWDPVEAVAGADGQFGYTVGRYRTLTVPADGVVQQGTYLTVWRRTASGWRVIADIGNVEPPPIQ